MHGHRKSKQCICVSAFLDDALRVQVKRRNLLNNGEDPHGHCETPVLGDHDDIYLELDRNRVNVSGIITVKTL